MFENIMQKTKEKTKQFSWEIILKIIENNLNISDLEKKRIFKEKMNAIKDSFQYYDEEQMTPLIDQILEQIGIEENNREKFREEIKEKLKEYFQKSPEKKGINFRDKIEDPQEIRAWLYLILPEQEKEQFKNDFQQATTAKEAFYFRLWPPSIRNVFGYFVGKEKPVGYKSSEFLKDIQSYLEDIQQGKDRITLYFDENLLPEEFENRQEELENLGIHRNDNVYEIYITPEIINEMINLLFKDSLPIELSEHNITKKISEAQNLLKECEFIKKLPGGEEMYNSFRTFLSMLIIHFKSLIERGASESELKELEKNIDDLIKVLIDIKDQKKEKDKTKVILKAKDWLKKYGSFILASMGVWILALGWFAPLWLITKMYDDIEKSSMMKGK